MAALVIPAFAGAAQPRTSLNEIEGEVMCPICGTLLELADSPQAQREKAFISGLIAEGKTRAQVKDALVAQYGQEVLALPRASGFDLSAYLVPVIGFAIAAVALAIGVLRWRRHEGPPGSGPPAASGPTGEDAERLDADLARYDL
ncbi:MAG TPA: cytochrome c-type biogenesis protein CcmH [Solirubrobacterales bacterium]|nr:cytochrome c-type biogenesis protein CcmH [Solirubrobacterales bacterium]